MCHGFCALGAVAPSSDFLVRSGPFVRSVNFSFFILSVCRFVGRGKGGKPAENATFLNTRETQHEPQFLLSVTTPASAELRGPILS